MHPILPTLFMCLLLLWPVGRIYRRVGLSPYWALLVFFSIPVPFLGLMLVCLPLAVKPWPNFPKAPPAPTPVKVPL